MKILIESSGVRLSVILVAGFAFGIGFAAGAVWSQVTGVPAKCPQVFPKQPWRQQVEYYLVPTRIDP